MATEQNILTHLENMEDYRTTGYIVSGTRNSGITIAYGVDLSQPPYNTEQGLRDAGFSEEFISKCVELDILGKTAGQIEDENRDPSAIAKQIKIPNTKEEKEKQGKLFIEKNKKLNSKYADAMDDKTFVSYSTMTHWGGGKGMSKEERDAVSDPTTLNAIDRKAYVIGVINDDIDAKIEENGTITSEEYSQIIYNGQNSVENFRADSPMNTDTLNRERAFVGDVDNYMHVETRNEFIEQQDNEYSQSEEVVVEETPAIEEKELKKPKRHQFKSVNAYNKAKKEYEEALKIQKEKAEVIEEEEKEEEKEKVEVIEEPTETKEPQYKVVLDAEGNEIRIPIGPDVTEQDIRQETQTEQKYDSWKDLFDNIDNIDKSQPVYVGNNKFKWQESGDNNFVLINEDGEELTGEEYSHIYDSQREARLNREAPPESDDAETSKKYSVGDIIKKGDYTPFEDNDGNLISDQDLTITGINADGTYEVQDQNGQVNTINPADQGQRIENNQIVVPADPAPIIKQESSRVTNTDGSITVTYTDGTTEVIPAPVIETDVVETPDITTEDEGPGLMEKIGSGVGATLKGAGTLLDSIGGPSAIISYIMGKEGLKHAMKEIEPQKMPELSPLFHQHLRQTRELAKKGFHPAEARKIRKEIDAAYEQGLDNAVRGTSGDRAKFLAHSGILDSKRSSALLDFATQDAALQRENQDKYVDTMMFKENFEAQRSEKLRAEDMQMQMANKQSAAQFTSAAFSNLMSGLGGGNSALIRQMMQMYQGGGTTQLFNTANPNE